MNNVIIYTTPACQYCKMAKKLFNDNNIRYNEIDVASNQEAAHEMTEKSGQMGVPVIIIENNGQEEIVIGYDQERLKQLLNIN